VLSGFSSTATQISYWSAVTSVDDYKLSGYEIEGMEYLRNILQNDPRAFLISPSERSIQSLVFSTTPYTLSFPEMLISSVYPEVALYSLSFHNLAHAYIYMHERDYEKINQYPNSWFNKYLLKSLPIIYSNPEVTIFNVTHVNFPQPNSDTVLIKPIEEFNSLSSLQQNILSYSNLNYTTMYETDPMISQAKNLVLEFDPLNTYNIQEDFKSTEGTKGWADISGSWEKSASGLQGSTLSTGTPISAESIALSPYSSKYSNSTISTSFTLNTTDNLKHNIVALVYSWIDPKNYRFAGIDIWNEEIYMYFGKVGNGHIITDPPLPGSNTNIKFEEGLNQQFNLSLSLSGDSQELHLNNKFELKLADKAELGLMGLSYWNIPSISFKSFDLQELRSAYNQQVISQYISFVNSGGNLTVIDPPSHGVIYNIVTNAIHNDTKYDDVFSVFNGPFVKSQTNASKDTKYDDVFSVFNGPFVKSQTNASKDTKYDDVFSVTQKKLGLGTVTYIDINQNPMNIGNISNVVGLLGADKVDHNETNTSDIFKKITTSFKDVIVSGNTTINTNSLIFPDNYESLDLRIMTQQNEEFNLENVTSLNLYTDKYLQLSSVNNALVAASGKGLYSSVFIDKNFNNESLSSQLLVRGILNNSIPLIDGETNGFPFKFENISTISIYNKGEPLHIYARQPQIDISGNTTLTELTANLQYSKIGYQQKQDLSLSGKISMDIFLSDTYSYANRISIDKNAIPLQDVLSYNYFEGIIPSTFSPKLDYSSLLILIPISITIAFIAISRIYSKLYEKK
jgi:hypothetical protein